MSKQLLISRKQELPLKGDSTGFFLQVITSISVFLFAVTLAGVLSINTMITTWNESILGSLTVQIMPVNNVDREKAHSETVEHQNKALEFFKSIPEVAEVRALEDKELYALIQPWLGEDINLDRIPIPRLLDIKIKPGASINFTELAEKLAQVTPYASLDNHKLWLNKLIYFADGLKVLAIVILAMVVLISSGAIFYTTKTSLGLHQYVIEILHQLGAKDTYVAQQYAKRNAYMGFVGGLIGLMLAVPTIFIMSSLASQIQGGIISEARLSKESWLIIGSIPFFASFIAMTTAYCTVKRTLGKMM